MHYVYEAIVLATNTVSNPKIVDVKLAAGIIKHVSVVFPPGCSRLVRAYFWNNAEQLLPSNPEAYYAEDAYSIEVDCYFPTWAYGNDFRFIAWNIGTLYQHNIHLLINVQGVDEPAMAEVTETLQKTTESLATALKGLW